MRFNRSQAFTIIEVTAAAAILAVILGALVPATLLVRQQRREAAVHRQALSASDNLLERVLALPWDEINDDLSGEEIQADEILANIAGGTWKVAVEDAPDTIAAKRVAVEVSYGNSGRRGAVELVAWAYRDTHYREEP